MPNGGKGATDCCGTCWFNEINEGQAGLRWLRQPRPIDKPERHFCTIRELPIRQVFSTYCANHPFRNPGRIEVPIGPVLEGRLDNYREIWKLSPDAEEVRLTLLALLRQIEEKPRSEYRTGVYLDEIVIWQLGEFREKRAVDELRRIVGFSSIDKEVGPFKRTRRKTVQLAQEALAKIEGTLPLEWTQDPEDVPHPFERWGPPYCGCDSCRWHRQAMGVQIPEFQIGKSPAAGHISSLVQMPQGPTFIAAEPAVYARRPWWKRILGR